MHRAFLGRPAGRCLAHAVAAPLPLQCAPHPIVAGAAIVQRRSGWWWDTDAHPKKRDKPLIAATLHVFVKGSIPVVLLQTVRGLGQKGAIVSVRRGYARHNLVPKGLAVLGTWENIDEFADSSLIEDPTLKGRVTAEVGRLAFDWVGEIRLEYVKLAREDQLSTLLEPITVWEVLKDLSDRHELDLLPGSIDLPEGGITEVGVHEVPVRIAFRNPETAAGTHVILLNVVSEQSNAAEVEREEMAEALRGSRTYVLPERVMAAGGNVLSDDEDEFGGLLETSAR
eukprot:NODE_13648_length_1154_cov_5.843233.p1 GENE.NODE_13648_length_1154_cov_5.843233~~NODE_13648_length_1154_cov_5.843233.p1  ORF type:complete len:308 (-),score=80.06 NODE_13648_length_1154_cov_5.843233:230-1078(-)